MFPGECSAVLDWILCWGQMHFPIVRWWGWECSLRLLIRTTWNRIICQVEQLRSAEEASSIVSCFSEIETQCKDFSAILSTHFYCNGCLLNCLPSIFASSRSIIILRELLLPLYSPLVSRDLYFPTGSTHSAAADWSHAWHPT